MERRKKKRLKTVRKGNEEEEKRRRDLAEEGCTGEKIHKRNRRKENRMNYDTHPHSAHITEEFEFLFLNAEQCWRKHVSGLSRPQCELRIVDEGPETEQRRGV